MQVVHMHVSFILRSQTMCFVCLGVNLSEESLCLQQYEAPAAKLKPDTPHQIHFKNRLHCSKAPSPQPGLDTTCQRVAND